MYYTVDEFENRKKEIFERLKDIVFEIDCIESELSPLECQKEELEEEWKQIQSEIKEIELRTAPKLNMFEKAINDKHQVKLFKLKGV